MRVRARVLINVYLRNRHFHVKKRIFLPFVTIEHNGLGRNFHHRGLPEHHVFNLTYITQWRTLPLNGVQQKPDEHAESEKKLGNNKLRVTFLSPRLYSPLPTSQTILCVGACPSSIDPGHDDFETVPTVQI